MSRCHKSLVAGAFAAVFWVSGCGKGADNPAGPAPITLTGVWVGDVVESHGGRGQLQLTIDQIQFALIGTFSLEFADASFSRSGTVTGAVATSTFPQRMQLTSRDAFDCAPGASRDSFLLLSWTQTGDTLSGTYSGFACVGTLTGSFEVVRQR